MILFLSQQFSGTADVLMNLFQHRNISVFRLNLDMFESYKFLWNDKGFEIINPVGHCCKSHEISEMCFFHGSIPGMCSYVGEAEAYAQERQWLISWLNCLYNCFACYARENKLTKLWSPYEVQYAKTLQMKLAKKYFHVPEFKLHWGHIFTHHKVIAKPLTSRPLSNMALIYARVVDQAELDPMWPWFTQEIAEGNRDAPVVYINGKVHCYQFASERGNLTDWRVTQGTDANQWIPWDAGTEFEENIRLFMKDINLKYGRLDFIIGGNKPQFLEVNPSGQFDWLDDEKLTLHNEVVDAILDPTTTILG